MIDLKKVKLKSPMLILCVLLLYSCGSTKDGKIAVFKNKNILITGELATKDETYANIKGSVLRLRAMLCGKFISYHSAKDPERKKYSVWLINGGKDSVIAYQIPVGNYHKDGYWMYQYQCLTSLPEDPIFEGFSRLTKLSRDTIKEVHYKMPEELDRSIGQILKDPKAVFGEMEWKALKLNKDNGVVYYVRQTLLSYSGESSWRNTENSSGQKDFGSDYYIVEPSKIAFGTKKYDKNKKLLRVTIPGWLVKEAMIRPDLLLD